jgi:hypothetical protein
MGVAFIERRRSLCELTVVGDIGNTSIYIKNKKEWYCTFENK